MDLIIICRVMQRYCEGLKYIKIWIKYTASKWTLNRILSRILSRILHVNYLMATLILSINLSRNILGLPFILEVEYSSLNLFPPLISLIMLNWVT